MCHRTPACVAALALCALLTASCTLPRVAPVAPALYDLGQISEVRVRPHIDTAVLVPTVRAPAWLDTTGITYRLAYEDGTRLRAYANSRWADTPAALLTERLRSRLAASAKRVVEPGDGARADYALRMELEEFGQTFDAPQRSRVTARARVSIVDLATRNVEAQTIVRAERPAAPSAAGSAAALAEASRELLTNVLDWTAENLNHRLSRQSVKK